MTQRVPRFLGIDPGLAHEGLAAIESPRPGEWRCIALRCLVTKPPSTKDFARQSMAELDRIETMFRGAQRANERIEPDAVGVENYSIFRTKQQEDFEAAVRALKNASSDDELLRAARRVSATADEGLRDGFGLGRAAKTIAVYGTSLAVAWQSNLIAYTFEPSDKKKFLDLKNVARRDLKRAIIAAVSERLEGFSELLAEKVPQSTLHEHVADAATIAMLTAERWHVRR